MGTIFFSVFPVQQHLHDIFMHSTINSFIQQLSSEEIQAIIKNEKHLSEQKDINLRDTDLDSTQSVL